MAQSTREKGTLKGSTRKEKKSYISFWPVDFSGTHETFAKAVSHAYVDFLEYTQHFIGKHSDATRTYYITDIKDKNDIWCRDAVTGQYTFVVTATLVVKVVIEEPTLDVSELLNRPMAESFA